jgi:hypothetical protein
LPSLYPTNDFQVVDSPASGFGMKSRLHVCWASLVRANGLLVDVQPLAPRIWEVAVPACNRLAVVLSETGAARYKYHPKYVLAGRVVHERPVCDPIRSDPLP